MKRIFLTTFSWIILTTTFGQNANDYFQKGIKAVKEEKLDEAISFFDKAIEKDSSEFIIWYNRATVKGWQKKFIDAIKDYSQAIKLNPTYKKALNGRATSKQDITDYDGAMLDFNEAIRLDSNYIDAIYNRGSLYDLLGKRDEACKEFKLAYSLGDEQSKNKVERCNEPALKNLHSILRLTKISQDNKYGFSSDKPIMVGAGPDGGPANQRAYLNLLRDVNSKPISYERTGSCCDYKSENGFMGLARLDKYAIFYTDEQGKEAKSFIYISMYDYEEPQIIGGFKTVGGK